MRVSMLKDEEYEYPPRGVLAGVEKVTDRWIENHSQNWRRSRFDIRLALIENRLNELGYSLFAK
jgi:hypothetical protein